MWPDELEGPDLEPSRAFLADSPEIDLILSLWLLTSILRTPGWTDLHTCGSMMEPAMRLTAMRRLHSLLPDLLRRWDKTWMCTAPVIKAWRHVRQKSCSLIGCLLSQTCSPSLSLPELPTLNYDDLFSVFLINKHGCPATKLKLKLTRHSYKHLYHSFGEVFHPYRFAQGHAYPPLKPEMMSSGIFLANRT